MDLFACGLTPHTVNESVVPQLTLTLYRVSLIVFLIILISLISFSGICIALNNFSPCIKSYAVLNSMSTVQMERLFDVIFSQLFQISCLIVLQVCSLHMLLICYKGLLLIFCILCSKYNYLCNCCTVVSPLPFSKCLLLYLHSKFLE